jgi:hypothetical protein
MHGIQRKLVCPEVRRRSDTHNSLCSNAEAVADAVALACAARGRHMDWMCGVRVRARGSAGQCPVPSAGRGEGGGASRRRWFLRTSPLLHAEPRDSFVGPRCLELTSASTTASWIQVRCVPYVNTKDSSSDTKAAPGGGRCDSKAMNGVAGMKVNK